MHQIRGSDKGTREIIDEIVYRPSLSCKHTTALAVLSLVGSPLRFASESSLILPKVGQKEKYSRNGKAHAQPAQVDDAEYERGEV